MLFSAFAEREKSDCAIIRSQPPRGAAIFFYPLIAGRPLFRLTPDSKAWGHSSWQQWSCHKDLCLLKTKRWMGWITKPELEVFPGEPLNFGRKMLEAITKAFRCRGIHRAGRWISRGFPIEAARKVRATCRFGHLPRSAGPTCGFVRRRTNAPIEQTPPGGAWRWLVRFQQRNSWAIYNSIHPANASREEFRQCPNSGAHAPPRAVSDALVADIVGWVQRGR